MGMPDVVDDPLEFLGWDFTANCVFDVIDQHSSLLDSRAGTGATCKLKGARVHAGEEVLPKERNKQPQATANARKSPR